MHPPFTRIVDLDGTLCRYDPKVFKGAAPMELLPGTLDKIAEWRAQGDMIILITGRPASRTHTVRQLIQAGVNYDILIMGVGGGKRIIYNDIKPNGDLTAEAHNLVRDVGIGSIT